MIKNTDASMPLCNELEEWCKAQKLPYIRADDLASKGYLTADQKTWLAGYRLRWENLKAQELKNANGIARDATMMECRIAKSAAPMLDLHKRETGWKAVTVENGDGTVLVSSDGKTSVPFLSTNQKSGTEGIRQSALAQGYAIDHPYVTECPVGELVVTPIFASTLRPRG